MKLNEVEDFIVEYLDMENVFEIIKREDILILKRQKGTYFLGALRVELQNGYEFVTKIFDEVEFRGSSKGNSVFVDGEEVAALDDLKWFIPEP